MNDKLIELLRNDDVFEYMEDEAPRVADEIIELFDTNERESLLSFCGWIQETQPIAFQNMYKFVDEYFMNRHYENKR